MVGTDDGSDKQPPAVNRLTTMMTWLKLLLLVLKPELAKLALAILFGFLILCTL